MLQAPLFDGPSFGFLPFQQNRLAASKVDIGGCEIGDAFVIAPVVANLLDHPSSALQAHFFAAMFHLMRRDARTARQHAEVRIGLSRKHGIMNLGGMAGAVRGWARAANGELAEGIRYMR